MTLMDTLRADLLTARKAKDTVASGLLTALVGEAAMIGKNDGSRETTDPEVQKVVKKFLDGAAETLALLDKRAGGDASALEGPRSQAEREITILSAYQPQQVSSTELRQIVVQFKASNPDAKIGQYMGHLKQTLTPGSYDGGEANKIVKEVIG